MVSPFITIGFDNLQGNNPFNINCKAFSKVITAFLFWKKGNWKMIGKQNV